jgi:hypothetical protein
MKEKVVFEVTAEIEYELKKERAVIVKALRGFLADVDKFDPWEYGPTLHLGNAKLLGLRATQKK